MVPTIHDVRGGPVPGLSGVFARPRPGALSFRDVLEKLQPTRPPVARLGPGRVLPAPRPLRPSLLAPSRPRGTAPGAPPHAKAALAAAIRTAAGSASVEPALSVAVARAESNLDPRARSVDGKSVGTFQMTAVTAAEMRRKIAAGTVARPAGSDDVALGVGYLRYLDGVFARRARLARGLETVPVADAGERQLFAIAAFNAGEGRVARAQALAAAHGADPTRFADVRPYLPDITRKYVTRVAGYAGQERTAGATV